MLDVEVQRKVLGQARDYESVTDQNLGTGLLVHKANVCSWPEADLPTQMRGQHSKENALSTPEQLPIDVTD